MRVWAQVRIARWCRGGSNWRSGPLKSRSIETQESDGTWLRGTGQCRRDATTPIAAGWGACSGGHPATPPCTSLVPGPNRDHRVGARWALSRRQQDHHGGSWEHARRESKDQRQGADAWHHERHGASIALRRSLSRATSFMRARTPSADSVVEPNCSGRSSSPRSVSERRTRPR